MSSRKILRYIYNNRKCVWSAGLKLSLAKKKFTNLTYRPIKHLRLYYPYPIDTAKVAQFCKKTTFVATLSILNWLGFSEEDEKKESELIMTLKRAVLCTQREQFEKAEQMLHVALRMAQQQHNRQGILYCYDLMANLALDTFQLDKAEKLFVSVLQMLLTDGLNPDDLKVIHISLKLARISHLKAENERADLGYKWCLDNIENQKDGNLDAKMLYGIIQDWYAQFLLDTGEAKRSSIHLKEAYEVCKETLGENSEKSMLLLNDLATTSFKAGDLEKAQQYMKEAVAIGKNIEDKSHLGVLFANFGLIMLQSGILRDAEKYCKEAWNLGRRYKNNESIEQANYCFDQIKLNLGK